MFSKLLGLTLNRAAGEGSHACQGSWAVQTEMYQGLGELVVPSIRAPWAASPGRWPDRIRRTRQPWEEFPRE